MEHIKTCFVIMPFNKNFDGYYSKLIKPAVESKGFVCERVDELYNSRAIIADIFEKIENSNFIIADVTERNPNVAYELGVAHALNKPVIIISQSINDVPFDFKHIRVCIYEPKQVDWAEKLRSKIEKSIDSIVTEPAKSIVHLFSNDFSKEKLALVNHLNEIYYQYDYTLSFDNEFYIKNNRTTLLKRIYTIIPKTNMLHFYQVFRVEKEGNFKLLKIQDPTTQNQLSYIVQKKTDKEFSFIILTRNLEEIGKSFRIEVQLEIDNYFENLFKDGESELSLFPLSKSRADYRSISETIYLPKDEMFKNACIEITNHPDYNENGKMFFCKLQPNWYSININFSMPNKEPFRNSVSYKIKTNHNNI